TEGTRLIRYGGEHSSIVLVQQQFGTGGILDGLVRADVVEMGMGIHDVLHPEPFLPDDPQNFRGVVPGIDDHRLPGFIVCKNEAVHLERAYDESPEDHSCCIPFSSVTRVWSLCLPHGHVQRHFLALSNRSSAAQS